MSLLLVGINHKNAPLEVREQLAFSASESAAVLPALVDGEVVREALILSTCNRVEILVEADAETSFETVVEFIARHKNIEPQIFRDYLYQFADEAAARHLFRVAASLDSMIVGETQILGQVRAAYKQAAEANTARRVLHKLLHHAFQTAKRVRTETNIAHNAVSVSSAAAEMAGGIFGSLENKTVLLIGAGEMAELAAKHLIEHGARRILIANRTFENAVKLAAQFDGGEAIEFQRIGEILPQADIVLSSTNAVDYLITPEMTAAAQTQRNYQPTLLIDISVPRNIAPEVRHSNGVYLADVDALQSVVATNLNERQREAEKGEIIVTQEVGEFWQSLKAMNFGENLGALRTKMQNTARAELDKQRHKLGDLSPEQLAAVEKILLSTVNQIAHPILYGLRRSHEHGASEFAETLCELMNDFQ